MTTAQTLITAEQLEHMPEDMRYELVRGELVEMSPVGGEHAFVVGKLVIRLGVWAYTGSGGFVGPEAGWTLARDPDTTRAADVAYVRAERIPPTGVPRGFWNIPPDLAVEVVSPSESATEVYDKVQDYLAAGTPLVWVVYPSKQDIVAHTPDGKARTFTATDQLEDETVLPGFSCLVAELFQ